MATKKRYESKLSKQPKQVKPNLIDSMLMQFAKKVSVGWDKDEQKKLNKLSSNVEVDIEKDIPYQDKADSLKLDIYKKKGSGKNLPVIIDIHGGGFVSGSKESDKFFCEKLSSLGFLVFSIDYTLSIHGANIFDIVLEAHNATDWVINHLKDYGGNKNKIYLCGHSAGGMIATIELMLNLSEKLRDLYKVSKLDIDYAGLILNCGFMKFYDRNLPYAMFRRVVFPTGYEKDGRYKSIIFEKSKLLQSFPKTFIFTNNKDDLKGMSIYFYRLLKKNNVDCIFEKTKTGGHVGIIYTPDSDDSKKIFDLMLKFFEI